MRQGQYLDARADWTKAIEQAPQFAPSVFSLFDAAISVGDMGTAKNALDHIQRVEGLSESWTKMAAKFGGALGGEAGAQEILLRHANAFPRSTAPRLELARRLLTSGNEDAAMAHFHHLAGQGVAEAAFAVGSIALNRKLFPAALNWMQRAHELNPAHEDTLKNIAMLKELIEAPKAEAAV